MMESEDQRLHSPPRSAAAPRPKGILKNAHTQSSGSVPLAAGSSQQAAAQDEVPLPAVPMADQAPVGDYMMVDESGASGPGGRLQWDETNLTLHEIEKENTSRMKITEPKTPFVHGSGLNDDLGDQFALDGSSSASPSSGGSYFQTDPTSAPASGRKTSAAEVTKANTVANARSGSGTPAVGADDVAMAENSPDKVDGSEFEELAGAEDADMGISHSAAGGVSPGGSQSGHSSRSVSSRRRSDTSRSPSFSMPDGTVLLGRRASSSRASSVQPNGSSGAGEQSVQNGLRNELLNGHQANGGRSDTFDDDSEAEDDLDPQSRAKHAEFEAKRKGHYGNEAEALKAAKALAAEEDEAEDEEGGGLPPPVPALPSGMRG